MAQALINPNHVRHLVCCLNHLSCLCKWWQAAYDSLQAEARAAAHSLAAANREAERVSVQHAAEQQSRDAAALQARTHEVAAVREQADRCAQLSGIIVSSGLSCKGN